MRIALINLVLCAMCFSCGAAELLDSHVSGQVSIPFQSKVLSYGLPDSDDPNLLPYGELAFFESLAVGSRFYVDMTDIGEDMGRGDRSWDFWEVDFPVTLQHVFTNEEFTWLPTSVSLGAGYRYEYHPPRTRVKDTQFWVADVTLPDLWLMPCFAYERDVVRDNGTYLSLSFAHSFKPFDDCELTPSISQGWGDRKRVGGYLMDPAMKNSLNRAGLMDFQARISLAWHMAESLTLSAFVAYSDFLFDRHVRDASRNYVCAASGGKGSRRPSWCFPVGLAVTWSF